MKTRVWAWLWLALLVLVGWLPGSYFVLTFSMFLGIAVAVRQLSFEVVFWGVFAALIGIQVVLLGQVALFCGLTGAERRWYVWGGGTALLAVWTGAVVIEFGEGLLR